MLVVQHFVWFRDPAENTPLYSFLFVSVTQFLSCKSPTSIVKKINDSRWCLDSHIPYRSFSSSQLQKKYNNKQKQTKKKRKGFKQEVYNIYKHAAIYYQWDIILLYPKNLHNLQSWLFECLHRDASSDQNGVLAALEGWSIILIGKDKEAQGQ